MQKSVYKITLENVLIVFFAVLCFTLTRNQIFDRYGLQFMALLILLFILASGFLDKINSIKKQKNLIQFVLLTMVTIAIVSMTGYLTSPFFFLIYFLLFTLSLMLHPSASLVLSFVISLLMLSVLDIKSANQIIQIASLFIVTPLALLFGSQYSELKSVSEELTQTKKEEKELVNEVIDKEKTIKNWNDKSFKTLLAKIWSNLDQLQTDPKSTKSQKIKLGEIENQLKKLLQSSKDLEEKIEK